ncbi:hypothetical protein [Algoriphagus namhaensis]
MKKVLVLLSLAAILVSCSSTKIYPRIKCHVCLSKSDGILLLPLNWQESFRQLSISEQNELERVILEIFREEGFTQVALYDQMDYELLKAGIKDVNDPLQRANIDLELGIPYLLGLSLGELRWTGDWQNLEPSNTDAGTYWESDTRVSNSLRIALMETATGEVISDYAVTTTIDGLPIPIGDGESASLNFASLAQAVRISVRKGIKNFVADCSC